MELAILKENWDEWVSFDEWELNTRAVRDMVHGQGIFIGYDVPNTVLDISDTDTTLGSGAHGFGLEAWYWGKTGIVQCT